MSDTNVIPQKLTINKESRNKLLGNNSFVIWFTGLSGSGKSTLADNLEKKLFEKGILTFNLDGDNIRAGLNRDLSFSDADRKENIRRIGEITKLLIDSGIIVLTAFISPFRDDRKAVKELIGKENFVEIFVKCSLEICEDRDVKGLYSKARAGEIKNFTGIDSPYEPPENPELIIDTTKEDVNDSVDKLYSYIESKLKLL